MATTIVPGVSEPPESSFDVALSTAIAPPLSPRARTAMMRGPLAPAMLERMHRYWRAANYLCVGQIYLFENPLLREPLTAQQIKPRLLATGAFA